MPKYLVYIAGLRGPEAQIWDGEQTVNQKPTLTLFKQELTPLEGNIGLDELKRRYPPPIEAKS